MQPVLQYLAEVLAVLFSASDLPSMEAFRWTENLGSPACQGSCEESQLAVGSRWLCHSTHGTQTESWRFPS